MLNSYGQVWKLTLGIEHSFRFTECQSRQVLLLNPRFKMNGLYQCAKPRTDTMIYSVETTY
jgi:hypothetical protein